MARAVGVVDRDVTNARGRPPTSYGRGTVWRGDVRSARELPADGGQTC